MANPSALNQAALAETAQVQSAGWNVLDVTPEGRSDEPDFPSLRSD